MRQCLRLERHSILRLAEAAGEQWGSHVGIGRVEDEAGARRDQLQAVQRAARLFAEVAGGVAVDAEVVRVQRPEQRIVGVGVAAPTHVQRLEPGLDRRR